MLEYDEDFPGIPKIEEERYWFNRTNKKLNPDDNADYLPSKFTIRENITTNELFIKKRKVLWKKMY